MKVLLLSPELFRAEGGIARMLRLYLKALSAIVGPEGSVDAVTLNDGRAADPRLASYSGPGLRETVGCDRRRLRFARHVLRLARRNEMIVCGHLHLLPLAWLARRFNSRLRYALVAHGIEVWRPYTALERRALLGADRILCVSDYTRRQMLRFCPELSASRLRLVPNTLDPYFAPETGAPISAVPFDGPRILCVSRLSSADRYKGIDTLIEALPQFRRDFPLGRLRVVGDGDDLPRLREIAARTGVIGSVTFTGPLSDENLRQEYASCDFLALPSRHEGFGLVFLEAMTCGKPCLGARAGGIPEVIDDTVGRLVEYGDVPGIAAGLGDLARHPRDSEVVRRRAESFAFPAFQRRLAAALA